MKADNNNLITFKLEGDGINFKDMKAIRALKIIENFIKEISKVDKNVKINNIQSGSIAPTVDFVFPFSEIEADIKKSINNFFNKNRDIFKIIIEQDNKLIDTIFNPIVIENNVIVNVIDFFDGKIIDIGGKEPNINIHIDIIDNGVVIFPIYNIETAKDWRNLLYENVEIYAEVKQDKNENILKGIEIFELKSKQILNISEAEDKFYKLIKELDITDKNTLTQTILDMRHKDD